MITESTVTTHASTPATTRSSLPGVALPRSALRTEASSSLRNNDCAICLESIDPERANGQAQPCGHSFHGDCIDRWRASNNRNANTCPTCRTPLTFGERLSSIGDWMAPVARPAVEAMPIGGNFLATRVFGELQHEVDTSTRLGTENTRTDHTDIAPTESRLLLFFW